MNNYKKIILKNGMPLYFYKDENMRNTYFDFMIFYGSDGKWFDFNYDGVDYHVLPGCAHFLEHMLGEHSKYGNMYLNFARRNYKKNGQTSLNATHYFFQGKTEIKESIKELIEAVELPVFTPEDVHETAHAIAEETKMSRDNIYSVASALAQRNCFSDFEKFHDTLSSIGSDETTYALDYDTLKLCYDAFYHDENKAMIIAGNLEEKEVVDYIESIYENIPRHENKLKEKEVNYFGVRKEEDELDFDVKSDVDYLAYKTRIPEGFSMKEAYYYHTIYRFTKFGNNSDFNVDCFKNGLVNSIIQMWTSFESECLLFYIGVTSDKFNEYKNAFESNLYTLIDEDTFIGAVRNIIAEEARKYDDRFNSMSRFFINSYYTENFSDIEFLRSLTYDRFKEFISKLNYEDKTHVKIRKK